MSLKFPTNLNAISKRINDPYPDAIMAINSKNNRHMRVIMNIFCVIMNIFSGGDKKFSKSKKTVVLLDSIEMLIMA